MNDDGTERNDLGSRNEKSKVPCLVMEKESWPLFSGDTFRASFPSALPLSSVYFNLQVFDPDMSDLDLV